MLAAIENAQSRVHLEVYAFRCDVVGIRFFKALTDAAARGVTVRVTLDGWGSAWDGSSLVQRLRRGGCRAEVYHPLRRLFSGSFRRNHRKLLLVDDEVAFLGGINLTSQYSGLEGWEDLGLELRGPVPAWLGKRLRGERAAIPGGPVHIFLSGSGGGRRLRKRYLQAIQKAHRSIHMAHAYFLPDRGLLRSLTAASRRGVEVTLLLPGWSDVPFLRIATRSLYPTLQSAGIRILELHQNILHSKSAVVDGGLALMGSFNLDPLSLANLEALVEIHDPGICLEVEQWMEARGSEALPAPAHQGRWNLFVGMCLRRIAGAVGRLLAMPR